MPLIKIQAPSYTLEDKQYKLNDFCEEFSEFQDPDDEFVFNGENGDSNVIRLYRDGKYFFKNRVAVCPSCRSTKNVFNGDYERTISFLTIGTRKCIVKTYKCKKCGKIFVTDLSSIVKPNSNITNRVRSKIKRHHAVYGSTIRQIQYILKEEHDIDISYQTIENVLLEDEICFEAENWSYSGYYLFDSLWVKIKGKWNYLLALFDLELNTIISFDLAESEDIKTIYNFLNQSLANQKKIAITTDLKPEYGEVIDKLHMKHQLCKFHSKQKINRNIRNYIKENNITIDEKEEIKEVKEFIFKLLNAELMDDAKKIRKELFKKKDKKHGLIYKLIWKFAIPYFKKLTYAIESGKIASTSNKIENCFQKVFPKHIKRRMKSKKGILKRFLLRLRYWDINNKKTKNPYNF